MTQHWIDIKNANAILIMGSNAAEHHPISFKWVLAAKDAGAPVFHVDPKFSRTSARCDLHERLDKVRKTFPQAQLLDEDSISVVYLITEPRKLYHEYASRQEPAPLSRQAFLAMLEMTTDATATDANATEGTFQTGTDAVQETASTGQGTDAGRGSATTTARHSALAFRGLSAYQAANRLRAA